MISIIQENSYLLNKLNEDVKIVVGSKLNTEKAHLINVIINIKDENEAAIKSKDIQADKKILPENKYKVIFSLIFSFNLCDRFPSLSILSISF